MSLGVDLGVDRVWPRKSRYGPCDEARAIRRALLAMRRVDHPIPVLYGVKVLGWMMGERHSDAVWFYPHEKYWCGFTSEDDIIAKIDSGKSYAAVFGKFASLSDSQSTWFDLWQTRGSTGAAALTGAAKTARQFDDNVAGAIQHGGNVSPYTKSIASSLFWCQVGNNNTWLIYDRVLAYEACPETNSVSAAMTNGLPAQRYVTGAPGMRVFTTSQITKTASNLTEMTYVDQSGNAGHTMPTGSTVNLIAASSSSNALANVFLQKIKTTGILFLPLASGDTGVRSITSYTTSIAPSGTFIFVLCHPLFLQTSAATGIASYADAVNTVAGLERVYDGAHVTLAIHVQSGALNTANMHGGIDFIWG
jgi:hypothetical protein